MEQITKELLDQLQTIVSTYGPVVSDITMQVAWFDALNNLLVSGLSLLLSLSLGLGFLYLRKKKCTQSPSEHWSSKCDKEIASALCMLAAGICGVFVIVNLIRLSNPINWVGLSNPQLFLANKVYERTLNRRCP